MLPPLAMSKLRNKSDRISFNTQRGEVCPTQNNQRGLPKGFHPDRSRTSRMRCTLIAHATGEDAGEQEVHRIHDGNDRTWALHSACVALVRRPSSSTRGLSRSTWPAMNSKRRFLEMYGPPSDCKGKAKGRSTGLRKCIRPLCREQTLLAMMSCAACSS